VSKVKGRWFEVAQHADALGEQVVTVPEGHRFTVRGPVENVMIVQIMASEMQKMADDGSLASVLDSLQKVVRGGGFEGGMVVVPSTVRFMKLKPVDRLLARSLEQRDMRQKAEYRRAAKEMEDGVDEHGNVTELRPDTETKGEA
jgi:hypothetical protein